MSWLAALTHLQTLDGVYLVGEKHAQGNADARDLELGLQGTQ
jgi:hypothetical protein